MTPFEFGDIILMPFPFTDQSTTIEKSLVIKTLGWLKDNDQKALQESLKIILG